MWQIHFCPGCGAQVAYGDRFCGYCGFNLSCVMQQIPLQPPPYSQSPVSGNPNQYQQQYVYANGGTGTPISNEIYKLLADLFDKRIEHHKV
jgi:hypothetical protein